MPLVSMRQLLDEAAAGGEAGDFVQRTGIDALALAIGTSHGAYEFSRAPDGAVLSIELIEQIHAGVVPA